MLLEEFREFNLPSLLPLILRGNAFLALSTRKKKPVLVEVNRSPWGIALPTITPKCSTRLKAGGFRVAMRTIKDNYDWHGIQPIDLIFQPAALVFAH
jgi:hypothetical protein